MKMAEWIDRNGYKRLSLLRDDDNPENAERGIPVETIDVSAIDWENVQRELHNTLIDMRLLTWKDVQNKGGLTNAITSVLRREVIRLMKLMEKEKSQHG